MAKKEKWEIIASEYEVSLFPVFMLVDGFKDGIKKVHGQGCSIAIKLENNSVIYVYLPSQWARAHELIVKKITTDISYLEKIFSQIYIQCHKLENIGRKINNLKLSKKSNLDLYNLYQSFYKQNILTYGYGGTMPMLDFQKHTFFSDELLKYLKKKVKKELVSRYFVILTTPTKDTFDRLEQKDILKLYAEIYQKRININNLPKNIDTKLSKHIKKWAWLPYLYQGPAGDRSYFLDELKDFKRRKIDPSKRLREFEEEKEKIKNEQREIIKIIKPDKFYKKLIELARESVFLKVYRRSYQTKGYYLIEPLLNEIAKRLHLTIKQVRFMLPQEVKTALKAGRLNLTEINSRTNYCVYKNTAKQKLVFTGQKARDFFNQVKKEKIDKSLKTIKGTTACAGKAKGTVKIINSIQDMKKMKAGDILVSGATNPNLMPAIRQASAIVTDEGGLSCHAAIVSRELNIPCVVGTGFITQVVKDGDRLQVDANNAIVKKL